MINAPDRVTVWASELAAADFPPICVMTGRPAETWHRFRVADGRLRIVSGHLPMTKSAEQQVVILDLAVGLLALSFILNFASLFMSIAYSSDTDVSAIAQTFRVIGLVTFAIGITGLVIRRTFIGPLAAILDPPPGYVVRLVELRRVHPAFAVATRQRQLARAASPGSPGAPNPPMVAS